MWMALREAVKCAGTFDALRPRLRDGAIKACAAVVYRSDGVAIAGDNSIKPSWWDSVQDLDVATGRARFANFVMFMIIGSPNPPITYDIHVVGIELDADAVKALWPDPPKPSGRKRGAKPSKVWQEIFEHFDREVARNGKFPSVYRAASSVEDWLDTKNKSLSRSAIERGISKHRPDWIAA